MKKVLIVHQHYKSPRKGGAIRSYYLGQALVTSGIKTVIITTHNDSTYRIEHEDGAEIHYLPIAYSNEFGFISRCFSFLRFIFKSVFLVRVIKNIDVCYAISTPLTTGISARLIQLFYRIPFIFEVGDLWPEAPIQMGFIKNRVLQKLLYTLERYIYQHAESIVALSPMIKEAIEKIVPHKKVHLIPNMADTDYYQPMIASTITSTIYSQEKPFTISYIGAIGLANELEYVLRCAKVCQDKQLPIAFIICGEGARTNILHDLQKRLNITNVTFLPLQSREGIQELYKRVDAAFVSYKPIPILETGSPNKFFDGLAAGKLIIINFGGWIQNEIENSVCGVYVDPYDVNHFCEIIKPFLSNQSLVMEYQKNARTLALQKYSREMLSKKFAEIFLTR